MNVTTFVICTTIFRDIICTINTTWFYYNHACSYKLYYTEWTILVPSPDLHCFHHMLATFLKFLVYINHSCLVLCLRYAKLLWRCLTKCHRILLNWSQVVKLVCYASDNSSSSFWCNKLYQKVDYFLHRRITL